jgi:hypothetical protein
MQFSQVHVLKSVYFLIGSKWQFQNDEAEYFTPAKFKRFINRDTLAYFRRLGSRQVVNTSFTSYGRQCTRLVSYSPCGTEKHVYNFRFLS